VSHPRIEWLPEPAVLAPLAALVWIYVRRFRSARREAGRRGAAPLQAAAFAAALLALLGALASPIDRLGEDYLFSAHMLQHVLLGDIAPLLLLSSLSRVMMRPATRRLRRVEEALGPLASPVAAISVWLGAMYLWHVPAFYDAALAHPVVHLAEHASFFVAGLAVWWPLIQPVPMRRRLTGLSVFAYLLVAKLSLGGLGIVLTWSHGVAYSYYEHVPRIWGLSPIEDQNLGGAIMMVEQSIVLVVAFAILFVRMLLQSEDEERRRERFEDAAPA
jgi:cytochrome c oxidase assembly factor CtaG